MITYTRDEHENSELSWIFEMTFYEPKIIGDGNGFISWQIDHVRFNKIKNETHNLCYIKLSRKNKNKQSSKHVSGLIDIENKKLFIIGKFNFLYDILLETHSMSHIWNQIHKEPKTKKQKRRYKHLKKIKKDIISKYPERFL